jgi:DNA polymerase III gamma/tau subunit
MSDELELYKKHRPTTFKSIVGQSDACAMLHNMVKTNKVPHAILFSGPSGCGKTTLARILKQKLGCDEADFREINSGDDRSIDGIRRIRSSMGLAPMAGTCRIYLLDEAHQITGDAQEALLKMLEDTPRHVYFFLCTTDPQKLKDAIRTRCTEVALKSVEAVDVLILLEQVVELEDGEVSQEVLDAIVSQSDGSPRKALVLLQQVLAVPNGSEEDRLNLVRCSSSKEAASMLAKLLVEASINWPSVAAALKNVPWTEAENVRRMTLGYARAILLNQKQSGFMATRCFLILQVFRRNLYDSGNAGLVADCWDVYISSQSKK